MASTATSTLKIEKLEAGVATSWGDEVNNNMDIIDSAISGRETVSLNGSNNTLADANYTDDAAKKAVLYTDDADQDDRNIIIPNETRVYRVINGSSSYNCLVKTPAGSAVEIPALSACEIACDGSNSIEFVAPICIVGTGAPRTAGGAAASAVSVSPTGNLSSSNAQSAFNELQGDIDSINSTISGLGSSYQPLDSELTQLAGLSETKGNMIVGAGAWTTLGVGTNDYVLVAASGQSTGMKWAALIPSGTSAVFYESSAPTGWSTVSLNDYALRVVSSGGGSTGGSTAFTSVFTSRTITQSMLPNYNLTVTDPGHTHVINLNRDGIDVSGGSFNYSRGTPGGGPDVTSTSSTTGITVNSGGSGSSMNFAVRYANVRICTKSSY